MCVLMLEGGVQGRQGSSLSSFLPANGQCASSLSRVCSNSLGISKVILNPENWCGVGSLYAVTL